MPPKSKPAVQRDASPERKKSPQFVYIVFKGEAYEGGSNEGIFNSLDEAQVCAKYLVTQQHRSAEWKERYTDYWEYRSNYIEIQEGDLLSSFAEWKACRDSV